eukprot:174926-Prymnesium_polylepis.1
MMNEKAWATMSAGLLTAAYLSNETRNTSLLKHLEQVLNAQAATLEEGVGALQAEEAALLKADGHKAAAEPALKAEFYAQTDREQKKGYFDACLTSIEAKVTAVDAGEEDPKGVLSSLNAFTSVSDLLDSCEVALGLLEEPMRQAIGMTDGGGALNETTSWPHTVAPGMHALHELVDLCWRRAQELLTARAAQKAEHAADEGEAEGEEAPGGGLEVADATAGATLERWIGRRDAAGIDSSRAQKELVDQIKRAVGKLSVHRTEEDDYEEEEAGYDPHAPMPAGAFVPSKSAKMMLLGGGASGSGSPTLDD